MNKVLALRALSFLAIAAGFALWLYGGASAGFYREYYEVVTLDPILGFEGREKVEKFLPGIETLFAGFFLFAVLMLSSVVLESRQAKNSPTN